jgi:hypothetical protein
VTGVQTCALPIFIIAQTAGVPDDSIGKSGDYFIDNINNIIYGPKTSDFEWPEGVNY